MSLQEKKNTWDKTVVEVDTDNTHWLPISDVKVYDVGAENQEFGIELGPVCFR